MNQTSALNHRNVGPLVNAVDALPRLNHRKVLLDTGVEVYVLQDSETTGFKADLFFDAGLRRSLMPCLTNSTFNLMTEGTKNYSSETFHNQLDFYGSFLEKDVSYKYAKLSVYGVEKNFLPILRLVREAVFDASFPKEEVELFGLRQKQRLAVELQKNNVLAKRAFNKAFWGGQHPLGILTKPEDYDSLSHQKLFDYYSNSVALGVKYIVISGCCSDEMLHQLNSLPINKHTETTTPSVDNLSQGKPESGVSFMQKDGSVQASINMGLKMVDRTHPDYVGLQILSTALGGYFGSRLMKNIREEKGYTYGISCSLQSLASVGLFSIKTDVLNDRWEQTLDCIQQEIEKLKEEEIGSGELAVVKNYLSGSLARLFDGALVQSERLETILSERLDWDYYEKYLLAVKETSSSFLKELAIKYLNYERFTTLVVGSK